MCICRVCRCEEKVWGCLTSFLTLFFFTYTNLFLFLLFCLLFFLGGYKFYFFFFFRGFFLSVQSVQSVQSVIQREGRGGRGARRSEGRGSCGMHCMLHVACVIIRCFFFVSFFFDGLLYWSHIL
ncbi:hypothetical protein BZA77DRAFT_170811 [Pyronema omphalodes]|nr:hypothetical protein BZA77DRAFT_170811 [Pyronema omphalodes]